MTNSIMQTAQGVKGFSKKLYRQEVSRLAAIANKRIKRLEERDLTDSPAYRKLVENGVPKFSVRGKDFNQVQQEYGRLKRFLESQTSTIRGINQNLKDIAQNTGIKYKNLKELRAKANKFFELSSKVEQYLRTVDDMASAIGYHKIWEVINQYVKSEKIDLSDSENSIEDMVEMVTELIKNSEHNETLDYDFDNGFIILY